MADDLVAAFIEDGTEANQTGSSSSGWMTTRVLSESLRSLIIMNSASSEGSSIRSPFSLLAP